MLTTIAVSPNLRFSVDFENGTLGFYETLFQPEQKTWIADGWQVERKWTGEIFRQAFLVGPEVKSAIWEMEMNIAGLESPTLELRIAPEQKWYMRDW